MLVHHIKFLFPCMFINVVPPTLIAGHFSFALEEVHATAAHIQIPQHQHNDFSFNASIVNCEYFVLKIFRFGKFCCIHIFVVDDPCYMYLYRLTNFSWLMLITKIVNNKNFLIYGSSVPSYRCMCICMSRHRPGWCPLHLKLVLKFEGRYMHACRHPWMYASNCLFPTGPMIASGCGQWGSVGVRPIITVYMARKISIPNC